MSGEHELQQVYAKVSRVHQWLVNALADSPPGSMSSRGLVEDAEAELRELLGLDSTDPSVL